MHPVKRRKLDAVNSTLTKPFRSPLRTKSNNVAASDHKHDSHAQNRSQASSLGPQTPNDSKHSHFAASGHGGETPGVATPLMPSAPKAEIDDTDVLQRDYASLARKLTTLRQSLDTARQALKFETDSHSTDLDNTISKWRSIVQDTADELYEDAKHRVEKEGGVQSWLKKQVKEPPDIWYEERQIGLTDAQRKMFEVQRQADRAEAEKYGLVEVEIPKEGEIETVGCFYSSLASPLMHHCRASPWT